MSKYRYRYSVIDIHACLQPGRGCVQDSEYIKGNVVFRHIYQCIDNMAGINGFY